MIGLSITSIVIMIVGVFVLHVWLAFYLKGLKYNAMFESLVEEEFRFKDVYGFGYCILETIKYSYKTKADRKMRQTLGALYDEKYCEFYLRTLRSQQVTLSSLIVIFAFILYGMSEELILLPLFFVVAAVMFYGLGRAQQQKLDKRSEELLGDFSDVVSKLALLTNAGMTLHEAWQAVAYTGDTIIYNEMKTSILEINNGSSELDAIYHFGLRCMVPEIKKFASTISQGLAKGNAELSSMLQNQSKETWGLKKQLVRRAGEKAASKLLIPIIIMFIGILIMIMVPIMGNLGI